MFYRISGIKKWHFDDNIEKQMETQHDSSNAQLHAIN